LKMKLQKSLASRLIESSGILFAALLLFAAIAYALTTWGPGNPPEAAPGDGNVAADFLIETYAGTPPDLETGRIWIDTTVE
ncbi:MAG: hypothetical protein K9L85_03130, partial [Candidatus Peribacteraceae bacterium]|nr:hypothetical protein [Candidatus Peribacteraceae bacterium]MCF7846208.1 hypothetical protein [Candidatus Peribacteraceae bacterium]